MLRYIEWLFDTSIVCAYLNTDFSMANEVQQKWCTNLSVMPSAIDNITISWRHYMYLYKHSDA